MTIKRVTKKALPPFLVGEEVLCAYDTENVYSAPDSECWRTTITRIKRALSYGSGWLVEGAASKPCKCCGHVLHQGTGAIDSGWFRKLPQPKKRKPVKK
jgi:hypothetical protein